MQTLELTQLEFRNIIQKKLNITNPVLLKSGALGVITEYLANIKYDMANYYSGLFREMNQSLARDFNSMLFHSSVYDTPLQYAKPSVFNVSFIIPEIAINNVKFLEFEIPKNFKFINEANIDFLIPDKIQIIQSANNVTAYAYNKHKRNQLFVTTAPDPIKPNKNIFLVHYDNVVQLKRTYKKVVVPNYPVGENFKFGINVSDYKNIKSISTWLNRHDKPRLQMDIVDDIDPNELHELMDIERFNNKFFKFKSNRLSMDLFMDIFNTNISFEAGDGRIGKHLATNDEIIICLEESLGESGNLNNLSFLLEDIQTKITSNLNAVDLTKMSINGISIDGGKDGSNIQSVEEMREDIFNKISYRQSLTSINDFEIYFSKNKIKPFVDCKFLDGQNFVYIYNALETKQQNNSVILDTYSYNMKESDIAKNPFYPEIVINGKKLVSPFYYKFLSTNETEMFLVNPKIYIDLSPDLSNNDNEELVFSLNYNFETNKSFFVLEQGAEADKSYIVNTDHFAFTLDFANNYTYEVNTLHTDEFCIVKYPIEDLSLTVKDINNNLGNKFYYNHGIYQLIPKQVAFKYYYRNETDFDTAGSVVDLDKISLGYLDNELREILTEADKILHPYANKETSYLLKLPFIEESFVHRDFTEQYTLLDEFFKVKEINNLVNFNTRVFQCFYNTIYLDSDYNNAVYKKDNNISHDLKKAVSAELHIDKKYFDISTQYETLSELKLSIEIDIINFFKRKRGFEMRYFESELENIIYQKYNTNSDYPYVKNIEIVEPSSFIINDSDTIYYKLKDNMDLDGILDFCPPFFQFDLQNINIHLTF